MRGRQNAIAALALGAVKRGIGGEQKLVGRHDCTAVRGCNTATDRDPICDSRCAVGDRKRPDPPSQPLRVQCRAATVYTAQHHSEFLTAIARHQIAVAAECFIERAGDTLQDFIAADVAVRVVVVLELIKIEEDEGQRFVFTPRSSHLVLECAIEVPAIRNPREGVDRDESFQALIDGLERQAQTRELSIARGECLGTLSHPILEIRADGFQLGFDTPAKRKLRLELAGALVNTGMQDQRAHEGDDGNDRKREHAAECSD